MLFCAAGANESFERVWERYFARGTALVQSEEAHIT